MCARVCLLQGVAEAECRRAAAAAEEVYAREFDQEGTPADDDSLLQEHLVRHVRLAMSMSTLFLLFRKLHDTDACSQLLWNVAGRSKP